MQKKLAKIKYFPNNFQILEAGDYVVCAISGKEISINDLNCAVNYVRTSPSFSKSRQMGGTVAPAGG